MVASEVLKRKFYNYVSELRVGVDNANYSYVGESAGLGPVMWGPNDPWVVNPIPGGSLPIFQLAQNYHIKGQLQVRDLEALTQLFKTIDVVAGGGVEPAMSSSDRNLIGYFAVVAYHTEITNATDGRTAETRTHVFDNVRVRTDKWNLAAPQSPVIVEWYADDVTETDS
jgi:hypothetical protein